MQKSGNLAKNNSLRLTTQQSLRRLGLCSQITTAGQHSSPVVFPEKRSKGRSSIRGELSLSNNDPKKEKNEEHRIDIGDEQSDLLGYEVFSGKLVLDKGKANKNSELEASKEVTSQDAVEAKLTSKAMVWGSGMLRLEDVISVSYCPGLRHFTIHSYPLRRGFLKTRRSQKDFRFLASSSEEALQWVNAFADQQCYVNILPHPLASSKKQASDLVTNEFPLESYVRCKNPPRMLVILNPRSGRGRSSKVFHGKVEPIFKLAGFKLEVVKTTSAGHAKKLASTVDFSTCPDGIICVGGDGIVNEVLNGLLSRDNQKEAISIPIGIIPAGSDNSLVWTVLGVRDPVSAAIAIVKGGLTATDVFAVEWVQSGRIHFGTTVTYFGFVSDVLELSEKYQKRFGPLRYFVAGFLKFMCLPKYSFEVEYLPAQKEATGEGKGLVEREVIDMSELYTDIMRRSSKEGLPRASSLSSIDSIMTPSRMSAADLDTTCSSTEPSEYVRAIDAKSKRLSAGRSGNTTSEPEVIHPQLPLSATPNWPRTRSKSRTDKGWSGLTATFNSFFIKPIFSLLLFLLLTQKMPTTVSVLSNITDFVVNEGHGVKGLSEMGLQTLPKQYIQPLEERITPTTVILDDQIPVIDMSNWDNDTKLIGEKICNAAEKWGFFQIINHDISLDVLESVKEATYRFFRQPAEEKNKHSKENSSTNNVRYGTSFTPKAEKALEWKDYLSLFYVSDEEAAALWPSALREEALDFLRNSEIVIKKLLEALMKGLNVKEIDETKESLLMGSKRINVNYYPKCPNPELTVGVGRHSDVSTLTILLQDNIGGLYVKKLDSETWVHVPPIDGALVINIGDALQIMSNGRYKSIEHRVMANGSNNRISVPIFVNPKPSDVIGPLAEVLENGEEPIYKQVLYSDYVKHFFRKAHDGKDTVDFAKIK